MCSFKVCLTLIALSVTLCSCSSDTEDQPQSGLVVYTVASERNDAFSRFEKSLKKYGHQFKVLGMGEEWKGGDMNYAGGGYKINLLKDALQEVKDNSDLVVMVVDSYDLVLTDGPERIMEEFEKFKSRVVFSTEGFCWPDPSLAENYPSVKPNEKRYLNSGGFIGYAPDLYGIVTSSPVDNTDDDQLFYTKVFLNPTYREQWSISLDTRGEIFQNLNGALHEVSVKFKGAKSYLYNSHSGNSPIVIHGNGPVKNEFNSLTNYLMDQWTQSGGCQSCKDDTISLKGIQLEDYPKVMIAIFIEHPTAFIAEFFTFIRKLNYPKNKINMFIHYTDEYHRPDIEAFMDEVGTSYNNVQLHSPISDLNDWTARNRAIDECMKQDCQYLFSVDGDVQLENANVLQTMIERNRSVIAPIAVRPQKLWSNFWGAVNTDGFYKRADDYQDILQYKKMGIWNVPYLTSVYLIHGSRLPQLKGGFINGDLDADMALCKTMRDQNIFFYLDNLEYYAYLINSENFETTHKHNDMYQIFDNPFAWGKKYIREDYYDVLYNKSMESIFDELQPCPDVFWIPIATPTFCDHLVGEMENLNDWSGGKNEDARLEGGYESVPTVDTHVNQIHWEEHWLSYLDLFVAPIAEKLYKGYTTEDLRLAGGYENVPTVDTHTNQIGWEQHWLKFLKDYIAPINAKLYKGYHSESRAIMNFVVRYKPDEQDRLRPHSDSSTFTINVALNNVDEDFEGGGVRFLRYNCTVAKTKKGWLLMHPGRLTHEHEGLPTTKGTRYIMVSFIDP